MEGNFWVRKGGLVKCLQFSMSDSPWEFGNWKGGALFRCHNKGASIAICEESGIKGFPLHVGQSYATKTCPTPNANSGLFSAKSLRAQNVLLPMSPMKASLLTLICWIHPATGTCFPVGGRALGRGARWIWLSWLSCLLLLWGLSFYCPFWPSFVTSNIPTSSWGSATIFSLWSTKICFQ